MAYKTQSHLIWKHVALSSLARQHQNPRRPRLLALPLVVLCALAYLGSAAHFALVQHETCAEHGETIHAGEVHARGPAEVEKSFADSRIVGTRQLARVSHGAETHCAHTFFRREAPPPPKGEVVSVELSATSGPTRAADVVLPEPVERLRLAPKCSPPHV